MKVKVRSPKHVWNVLQTIEVGSTSVKMLTRKQSMGGRDTVPLADFGPDENLNDSADIEWVNKTWARWLLRSCALISMISVSMNTPATFLKYPELKYSTYVTDIIIGALFLAESIAKIRIRGFVKVSDFESSKSSNSLKVSDFESSKSSNSLKVSGFESSTSSNSLKVNGFESPKKSNHRNHRRSFRKVRNLLRSIVLVLFLIRYAIECCAVIYFRNP